MQLQSQVQVMGIDAGGTMTDTFFVRDDGRFVVGKAQSNPADESLAMPAAQVLATFATDAPGTDEKELGSHKFGSGPVIQRGSTLDPTVFELLHAAGEAEKIPFTIAASAR